MPVQNHLSRRDVLKLLSGLGGLLGLGGLIRYFSYQPPPEKPSRFDLGNISDFPAGSRTLRSDIPAVIYNQGGVFTAYQLICSHLGCRVEEANGEFLCPCHGSRYDADGNVLEGPAQKPLPALGVEITADQRLILTIL